MSAPATERGATYLDGETVEVTITGTVLATDASGITMTRTSDGSFFNVVPDAGDRIRRVVPADGKPLPGDVWRDRHGVEWYARGRAQAVSLYDSGHQANDWTLVNSAEGPLTLVYRPEPVGGA